jgi:hypothetical protein
MSPYCNVRKSGEMKVIAGRPRRKVGFSGVKGIDDPAVCGVCGGRTFVIVIGGRFVLEAVRL